MAQKVEVVLTCDLDAVSTPAMETVSFSYAGQAYEFELCAAHLKEFDEVMQRFTGVARPAGRTGGVRARAGRPRAATSAELAAVRAWAQANGHPVKDRGRIPTEVRRAYDEAHA